MYNKKIRAEVKKFLSSKSPLTGKASRAFIVDDMEYILNSKLSNEKKLSFMKSYYAKYDVVMFHSPIHIAKVFQVIKSDNELVKKFLNRSHADTDFLNFLEPEDKKAFFDILFKNKAFYFFSFKDTLKIVNSQNCNEIMHALLEDRRDYLGISGSPRTALYIVLNHGAESDLLNMYRNIDSVNLNRLVSDKRDINFQNGFLRVFKAISNDHQVVKRLFKMIDFDVLCDGLAKEPGLNTISMRPIVLNIVLAISNDKTLLQKLILAAKKTKHLKELLKLVETRGVRMKEIRF